MGSRAQEIIRKTLLGRPKVQYDIERIIAATPVDQAEVDTRVRRLISASRR
jgi:hypothetical protein